MGRGRPALAAAVLLAGLLAGPRPAAAGTGYTECYDDGSSGLRVQLLYAHPSSANNLAADRPAMLRAAAAMETIVLASAAETGGERHLRFVTDANCEVDVQAVQVSDAALTSFTTLEDELLRAQFNRPDRLYLLWLERTDDPGCGGSADFMPDERPGPDNLNNAGRIHHWYGYVNDDCLTLPGRSGELELHELGHLLGAVQAGAPNHDDGEPVQSHAHHCTDAVRDVLCQFPAGSPLHTCATPTFDCGHDDYFSTAPTRDSYLATHWNTADSPFLDDKAGDHPPPVPDPPVLTTVTANDGEVVVEWTPPAAAPRAPIVDYVVYRDEQAVHTTSSASTDTFHDTDVTNGTPYSYTVTAENAAGESRPSTALTGTPQHFQPDLQVRNVGQAAYSGDDVYNTNGARQGRSVRTPRGATAAFDLRIQSDASGADVIRVTGPRSSHGFTVQYTRGPTDITRDITGRNGRHYDVPLAAGASRTIRVRITPTRNASRFSAATGLVTAASLGNGLKQDVVKLSVQAT